MQPHLYGNAIARLTGLLLLGLTCVASHAQPSPDPILRLGTDRHTAPIKGLAADTSGRLLLTVSYDKTARVWDTATRQSIRTLRVPIGQGPDGKLYSGALSPDGRLAAVGGSISGDNEPESIYLFDLGTGILHKRLPDLPNNVMALAFSPDGSTLAAALGNGEVHLFGARRGESLAVMPDCSKPIYGFAWSPDGHRFATACDDGAIRLYDAGGKRLQAYTPKRNAFPVRIAFSPNGKWLAVGYAQTPDLRVLNAFDLKPAFVPNLKGIDNGDLSYLAWSADGSTLYAGGNHDIKGKFPVFSWSSGGRGSRSIVGMQNDTISGIVALPNSQIAVTSVDTVIKAYAADGREVWRIEPVTANLHGAENLQVGIDGHIVRLRIDGDDTNSGSNKRVLFDLNNSNLQVLSPLDTGPGDFGLNSARTLSSHLKLDIAADNLTVRLNGQALPLNESETVHSSALLPEDRGFLLGTRWKLRCFDANGRQRWVIPAPADVWAVNVSRDGKVAVAAIGDGTVRWYRLSDGAILLNLFVARDGERWVAWTPQGYYMANPGGEQFIGWHINHGRDELPDFHAAAQLRERYFRPDVVRRVLETLDPQQALVLADQAIARPLPSNSTMPVPSVMPVTADAGTGQPPAPHAPPLAVAAAPAVNELPPVVTLLAPADGNPFDDTRQRLRFRIRSDAKVTAVKILVDGRPIPEKRALSRQSASEREQTVDVDLPARDVEVSVIAENRYGASPRVMARLLWNGSPPDVPERKPRLFVFAAGVGQYLNSQVPALTYPPKDANDFATSLQRQAGRLYREVQVRVPEKPDRVAIEAGLNWLKREVQEGDVAMLLLSGHGITDAEGRYQFLPLDVDPDQLATSAIPGREISRVTSALPGKVLVFLDTCHSGAMRAAVRDSNTDRIAIDLSQAESGVVVFAASTGSGYAQEDPAWGNGAFTKAILEGLAGDADYHKDGQVTVTTLDAYISYRVKALTSGRQTPTTAKPNTITDFPIAATR